MEELKKCCLCKKDLPKSNFHKSKSSKDGLQFHCKACAHLMARKRGKNINNYFGKLYLTLKHNSLKRAKKLDIAITKSDIEDLYKKQNGECALSKRKMTHKMCESNDCHKVNLQNMSIDRIDSNKHYTKDNIQLVCTAVNRMKSDIPNQEFINLCKLIAEKNRMRILELRIKQLNEKYAKI